MDFAHCVAVKCIYVFPEMLCFMVLLHIICVFILFPEVQKCYVFRHCALCKAGSFQWSVFETDITMS